MAVTHVYGSQSQYDELVEQSKISSEALYFINDTQRIYRGAELIVRTPIKFVNAVPSAPLQKDTLYVVTTQDQGVTKTDIYFSDGNTASNLTDPLGEMDPQDLFDKLSKFTSVDVRTFGLDSADDTKLATAGAVREALEWIVLEDPTGETGETEVTGQ